MDVPKGFFPQEDTGLLRGATEGPPDTSFEAMVKRQEAINEIIRKDPAVDYLNSNIGQGGVNQGFMFIALKPRDQRDDVATIIARVAPRDGRQFPASRRVAAGAEHQPELGPPVAGSVPVHAAQRRPAGALCGRARHAPPHDRSSSSCAT